MLSKTTDKPFYLFDANDMIIHIRRVQKFARPRTYLCRMKAKPSLPQGTRDFGPGTVRKRNYILETIRGVFELYGFQPLETPAMEQLETLMGKYGEDGEKLIFKILNNGLDNPEKSEKARNDFDQVLSGKSVTGITERALRYDLTIPFARYVAMNRNELHFPFKRYQMQPVWRADRPQKGRYREFFQCDADVVGSTSLFNELELALLYDEVFKRLKIQGYQLAINHRKILGGLAELCGGIENMIPISIAIDKLEKIGIEKVKEELSNRGINEKHIAIIEQYLSISGTHSEMLEKLGNLIGSTESGIQGINDLKFLFSRIEEYSGSLQDDQPGHATHINIDPTLARGLNYYTGVIFEAKPPAGINLGSIGGGGRYDDLTGLFGVPGIPGVGISFGIDRIYDLMEEMNLFPAGISSCTTVLFFNTGARESEKAFACMQGLRQSGISCELYHESAKFDKQFKYAEKKMIPYIIIIGEQELMSQTCTIKNLGTGDQESIPMEKLNSFLFI